ncbi:MAG: hypothetical protein PHE54_02445 [Bacilli bacterium]|nr:hypothetical protein [Bacilli bacterium]
MAKKLLLIIMMIITINVVLYSIKDEQTETVFNETDLNFETSQKYILDLSNSNITTKNIEMLLSNISDYKVTIYPYINKLYQNKLIILTNGFDFIYDDIETNINKFVSYYTSNLKKIGLYAEIEKTITNGVKIDSLSAYLLQEELINLKMQYPSVTYKLAS